MSSAETINRLLDAAKEVTGSHYKTAQLLGVSPNRVNDWRAGRQNPQPEDYALVASIAGLDPEEHLIRAILAKHADTPKGERLLSALGKGLRVIGEGATLVIFASVVSFGLTPRSDAAGAPYPAAEGIPSAVYYVKWWYAFLKLCRDVERITKSRKPRGDFARAVRCERVGKFDHLAQA